MSGRPQRCAIHMAMHALRIRTVTETARLYGDDTCLSHLQSQSSVGDLGGVTGVDGQRGGKLDEQGKYVNVNVNSIHFVANSCVCAYVFLCVWLRPW